MGARDQSEAVWTEIRRKLIRDPDISAAMGAGYEARIVRRALPGDALPAILAASIEGIDRGTDDSDAETVRIELHVWAKADDTLTVAGVRVGRAIRIKDRIKAALHWADIGTRCTVERMTGPVPDPMPELSHFIVVVEVVSAHENLTET